MEEIEKLIDLVENHINTTAEIDTAMSIYTSVINKYKDNNNAFGVNCIALASIYSIGRVHGIREERRKRG